MVYESSTALLTSHACLIFSSHHVESIRILESGSYTTVIEPHLLLMLELFSHPTRLDAAFDAYGQARMAAKSSGQGGPGPVSALTWEPHQCAVLMANDRIYIGLKSILIEAFHQISPGRSYPDIGQHLASGYVRELNGEGLVYPHLTDRLQGFLQIPPAELPELSFAAFQALAMGLCELNLLIRPFGHIEPGDLRGPLPFCSFFG